VENARVLLRYESVDTTNWVQDRFAEDKDVVISKTFIFRESDLVEISPTGIDSDPENTAPIPFEIVFGFASLSDDQKYWKIESRTLGIDHDVFFDIHIHLKREYFIAVRDISIFRRISRVLTGPIYIGFDGDNFVSFQTFEKLIRRFPNTTEMDKYANSRIVKVLRDEFDGFVDAEEVYNTYMRSRASILKLPIVEEIQHSERIKYTYNYDLLSTMLQNESKYQEKEWQHAILRILEVIFPKYVSVLEEVTIRELPEGRPRRLDFLLVDSSGNTDIVEIKRSFSTPIVTKTKYRASHVPMRELSGSIMQVEKYIFWMNRWGVDGENALTEKYREQIPEGLTIKITNPSGIVVIGREHGLDQEQKADFDIIRRKYKNVIDIITYDDLLRRLKLLIGKFSKT